MISLITEYFLAIALFFSFITLIFYGFPVAWTMGGLGVLFIFISMISDNLFDTFYGVDFGFASMVVYRLYGVMANWVLVALPMFIFMGIMMDKSGIAEALIATAIGLFAAIPAVLAFNHFTAKGESIYSARALFAEEMVALLQRQSIGTTQEDA